MPRSLSDEHEPHNRGEVKCEARNEQRRRNGQEIIEEGNGFGNDESHNRDDSDEDQPSDPTHLGVDVADD